MKIFCVICLVILGFTPCSWAEPRFNGIAISEDDHEYLEFFLNPHTRSTLSSGDVDRRQILGRMSHSAQVALLSYLSKNYLIDSHWLLDRNAQTLVFYGEWIMRLLLKIDLSNIEDSYILSDAAAALERYTSPNYLAGSTQIYIAQSPSDRLWALRKMLELVENQRTVLEIHRRSPKAVRILHRTFSTIVAGSAIRHKDSDALFLQLAERGRKALEKSVCLLALTPSSS